MKNALLPLSWTSFIKDWRIPLICYILLFTDCKQRIFRMGGNYHLDAIICIHNFNRAAWLIIKGKSADRPAEIQPIRFHEWLVHHFRICSQRNRMLRNLDILLKRQSHTGAHCRDCPHSSKWFQFPHP